MTIKDWDRLYPKFWTWMKRAWGREVALRMDNTERSHYWHAYMAGWRQGKREQQ